MLIFFIMQKLVQSQIPLTLKKVQEALDLLRGVIMIVYPMNLPPHDTIRLEIENNEDLTGTHASLEVRKFIFIYICYFNKSVLYLMKFVLFCSLCIILILICHSDIDIGGQLNIYIMDHFIIDIILVFE